MCASKAQREEVLSELLAQYELELSGGTGPAPLDLSQVETDAELAVEFREAKHCLELLDRVRRRWTPADVGDTLGMLRSALATPLSGPARSVGRFELLHELGRGGLGVVYLARDPKLERRVALKVPRIEVLASEEMRERFLRESEAAARLSHPHVVAVHEAGEDGTICYIATEYCPGPSLAEWLRSHTEPVDFTTAARLVRQLASAVQHAHSRGVLHRDIKPSNVLLVAPADQEAASAVASPVDLLTDASPKLIPKLADFGMAKLLERSGDETRSGAMIGTPAYMSPEQAQGRVRDVDARSDVYGLGAVLYELLTGRRPFDGETDVEVLRNVLFEEVPAPRRLRPRIPRDLEAITQKCLAKQPEARYATAQELADDLQRFLSGRPTEARPLSTAARVAKWARRRPAVAALVAAMIASVAALFGIVVQYNARLQEEVVRADQARLEAEREAAVSRQLLYAGDIRLAHDAYQAGNLPQMLAFLDQQVPRPGQQDIRNFAWHHLRGLGEKQVLTLREHEGDVFSVAYSPDGRRLATASKDGTVRLWDATTGSELRILGGHTSEVTSVAWSPDGSLLASGSEDHSVRLWDAETGGVLSVLEGHTNHVLAIAFSPDGKLLASGGRDLIVRVWDVERRTLREAIKPRQRTVSALAFSPDGSLLLATDSAGFVSCFGTSDVHAWMKGGGASQPSSLLAVGFSRISATVAAAGAGGNIDQWDWDAVNGMSRRRSFKHYGLDRVQCLAYSPVEETLAFATKDGVTAIWSFNDPNFTEPKLLRRIVGHTGRIWSLSWSPDGRYLATASGDNTVKVWDTRYENGQPPLPVVDKEIFSGDLSPDGSKLYVGGTQGYVQIVDLESRQLVLKRQVFDANSVVGCVRHSPKGQMVAVVAEPGLLKLVDAQTLAVRREVQFAIGARRGLTWTPDGEQLLVAGTEGNVGLIDASTGKLLEQWKYNFAVDDVAFSPSGEMFAVDCSRLKLYDARNRELLYELEEVDCMAFAPGEPLLATSSRGVISYWDPRTGQRLQTLKPQSVRHKLMRFSHDGRVLATSGWDSVTLWDARSGEQLFAFNHQNQGLSHELIFAEDDRCLFGIGYHTPDSAAKQAQVWEWRAESERHGGGGLDQQPPVLDAAPRRLSKVHYFTGEHQRHGRELWRTDGTLSGTRLVKDIYPGKAGSDARNFCELNGITYFSADDGATGHELWRTDGTAEGTWLVKDIYPGERGSDPQELVNVGGVLYFRAHEKSAGGELWRSDGTAEGTTLVRDIYPGTLGSRPSDLTEFDGILYFQALDGVHGRELWRSDGTTEGTRLITDLYPGSGDSDAAELTVIGSSLCFVARNARHGYELFATDGTETGTRIVKDINRGGGNSSPQQLTRVGNQIYFTADDGTHGRELWLSDGTPQGTRLVKDVHPGPEESRVANLTAVGETLYFRAHDGIHGDELWSSRGTAASTRLLADIYSGSQGSDIRGLAEIDGALCFIAIAGDRGSGLWRTDGTPSGTLLIKRIDLNSKLSTPGQLTSFGEMLLFVASDKGYGAELWKSDGTPDGTRLVKDLWPGEWGSEPVLNGRAADTPSFQSVDKSLRRRLSHRDSQDFGDAVAADDNIVVVGGPRDYCEATHAGRAYVFQAKTGRLLYTLENPQPQKGDRFGCSVAVSAGRIVIGAYRDDPSDVVDAGSAYVFDAATGELLHSVPNPQPHNGDRFGAAVAISEDRIFVGVYSDNEPEWDSGRVFVFDAKTCDLKRIISNPVPRDQNFGYSLAATSDYLVVGSHLAERGAPRAGTAYLFRASTGELLHELKNPSPEEGDEFGVSVAVAGDVIAVGANLVDGDVQDIGAAYVFSAVTGELMHTLQHPAPIASTQFGETVVVFGDQVFVGAHWHDLPHVDAGSACVFSAKDGSLVRDLKHYSPAEGALFGRSIAVTPEFIAVSALGAKEVLLFAHEEAAAPTPQPQTPGQLGQVDGAR